MERKRYLELCQKNAVYKNSVVVLFECKEYYPQKIQVWFDEKGETKNTAVILDKNLNSVVYANLESVVEVK